MNEDEDPMPREVKVLAVSVIAAILIAGQWSDKTAVEKAMELFEEADVAVPH